LGQGFNTGLDTGFDGKLRCSNCGSPDVRRSHSRGLLDRFMVMFRKAPFRCRRCERRFYSQHTARLQRHTVEQRSTGSTANSK
jgi:hypothetical protein